MAQQLQLKATYLAPSKHLGRVISKIVRETLPKTSDWKVDTSFERYVDVPSRMTGTIKVSQVQLSENYSTHFACMFQAGEYKELERFELTAVTLKGPVGEEKAIRYWNPRGNHYKLTGWIDFDIKKNQISIFYEVMGNVTRDLPTALSMVML